MSYAFSINNQSYTCLNINLITTNVSNISKQLKTGYDIWMPIYECSRGHVG